MFENKLTKNGGIHYSRYIVSWAKAAPIDENLRHSTEVFYGKEFRDWLRSEGCTEDEVRDIFEMATNGKLELEESARRFLKNA